ncbi:MAG TPA: hypothetical protein DCR93_32645, partial [Cytophagales bacterium]|nr:hypothetical protein [Cytophagales bacterium]
MQTQALDADVIIIGAGLSGLGAARRLYERGAKVLVLEANDRVGGRTLTEEVHLGEKGAVRVDKGGTWVGPGQKLVLELIDELGIEKIPTYSTGLHIHGLAGRYKRKKGELPQLGPLALLDLGRGMLQLGKLEAQVDPEKPETAPAADSLDAETLQSLLNRVFWSRKAREALTPLLRLGTWIEAGELSSLGFLQLTAASGGLNNNTGDISEGPQAWILKGGTQQLSEGLAKNLDVRLETPVQGVAYGEGTEPVTVTTEAGKQLRARYAIVALPPMVAHRLHYAPALPAPRRDFMQRMLMARIIKVFVFYEKPWWREAGTSGHMTTDEGLVCETYDYSKPEKDVWGLVGFIAGKHVPEALELSKEGRRQAVCEQLARIWGEDRARTPIAYVEHDWTAEPYSLGGGMGLQPPGVISLFGYAKARSPHGPLH